VSGLVQVLWCDRGLFLPMILGIVSTRLT
jgi:hypothetical protein